MSQAQHLTWCAFQSNVGPMVLAFDIFSLAAVIFGFAMVVDRGNFVFWAKKLK